MLVANVIEEGRLGGPQVRIAIIAKALMVDDIETVVFLPAEESDVFQQKLDLYGVSYCKMPLRKLTRNKIALVKYLFFFPVEIFQLYREFKRLGVDLVHCSGGAWQYKGVIAGRLAGAKTIWHLNDTVLSGMFQFVFRIFARLCADGIVVAADRVRQYYSKVVRLNKPVFEIQAPVDTRFFARDMVPVGEGNADGCWRVVSVGNLNPLKGYEYLVDAITQLAEQGCNITLQVIGATFASQQEYAARVRNMATAAGPDVVEFVGPVADVRPYLAGADLYVCSSITEASPLSVWEAMSMQVPVVSTDVGDVPRFVRDGISGRIVPTADATSLAQVIGEVLGDPVRRAEYARAGRSIVEHELDISVIARRHRECYETLLAGQCRD